MALPRPSAIAVHDDGYVRRKPLGIEARLQFQQGILRLLTVLTEEGSHAFAYGCALKDAQPSRSDLQKLRFFELGNVVDFRDVFVRCLLKAFLGAS